jgi:hypothetical protein
MNQHLPVGTKATEHRLVASVAEDPLLAYRPSNALLNDSGQIVGWYYDFDLLPLICHPLILQFNPIVVVAR